MSATRDTNTWDLDRLEADALERSRKACRERGEELERLAERMENARKHKEWLNNTK